MTAKAINLNKTQTTVYTSGKVSKKLVIKGLAMTNLERDMASEREYFTRLARNPHVAERITTIEESDNTLVVVYASGMVKIIHWVAVPD